LIKRTRHQTQPKRVNRQEGRQQNEVEFEILDHFFALVSSLIWIRTSLRAKKPGTQGGL